MMEPAHTWQRNQPRISRRLCLDGPMVRRILVQRIVNSVLVIILDVITDQAPQVLLIQRDHMVEEFPTTAADPAFRDSIGVSIQLHPIGAL